MRAWHSYQTLNTEGMHDCHTLKSDKTVKSQALESGITTRFKALESNVKIRDFWDIQTHNSHLRSSIQTHNLIFRQHCNQTQYSLKKQLNYKHV